MATKKYMGVAGQSFYSEDADKYFRDIFRGRVLDAVINDKSSLDVVWNMYEYGANPFNNYYNRGITQFVDNLPTVYISATRIDETPIKEKIEELTPDTVVSFISTDYGTLAPITVPYVESTPTSSVIPYDIKYTMTLARWELWKYYILSRLMIEYNYDYNTQLCERTVSGTRVKYKIDWDATGDPIGIDYSLGDRALDNTDYDTNEAAYKSSPFIVANEYTAIRTVVQEQTVITITNKDINTDSKRVVIRHITTVYDTFGAQQGQSTQTISDTLYDIPIGSESPSNTTRTISDNTVESTGNQVSWFLGTLPPIVTVNTTWTSNEGERFYTTTTTPIFYFFAIYTTTTGATIVWMMEGTSSGIATPTVTKSSEGDPKNPLSVMPVATLMNNDKILSETNDPARYESTNRLLDALNLNVDMLNDSLETKEPPIQSNDALLIWMAQYFTDEDLSGTMYLNPDYDENYEASKYPNDKTNRWNKYLLDPDESYIQGIVNDGLKRITEADATVMIDQMIMDLIRIHRVIGGVYDCMQIPDPNWEGEHGNPPLIYPCAISENSPDIKPWEEAFVKGLLRWLCSQRNITINKIVDTHSYGIYPGGGDDTSYFYKIVTKYQIIQYDKDDNIITNGTIEVSSKQDAKYVETPTNTITTTTTTITATRTDAYITAIDRVPDDKLILKRMNVYIRDLKTIYDTMEGDVEDVFVVMGINPITTAFTTGYDWTLPDNPKASETEEYNKKVEENYKKKGQEVVSKVLFNYFTSIYTSLNLATVGYNSPIRMDIEESPYFMHWSWIPKGSIPIQTVQGKIMPKGHYMHSVRWYHKTIPSTNPESPQDTTDRDWSLELWIYYQETETSYKLINIIDCDIWYESRRHGRTVRVPSKDDKPNEDTSANRACLIPLPLTAIKNLSLTEKVELFPYSLHMVIFAVKQVKTKWYQSGIFGIILHLLFIIVIIVVAVVPGLQGYLPAVLSAYVKFAIASIGVQLAIQLIMASGLSKEWKVALTTLVSIVAVAAGGGFNIGTALEVMTTALNVLNITTNAINLYLGFKTAEFADKTTELHKTIKERTNELNERNSQLQSALRRRQMLMDSFNEREYMLDDDIKLLISNDAFMYMCKEAYLNFDLCLEGNMDSISNYVDTKKQIRIDV